MYIHYNLLAFKFFSIYKFNKNHLLKNLECPELDTDYFGSNISPQTMENHPITLTWEECGKLCNDDMSCSYWTWLGSKGGNTTKYKCLLKASAEGRRSLTGAVSGNRNCTTQG